jgi:hypothetical protein
MVSRTASAGGVGDRAARRRSGMTIERRGRPNALTVAADRHEGPAARQTDAGAGSSRRPRPRQSESGRLLLYVASKLKALGQGTLERSEPVQGDVAA